MKSLGRAFLLSVVLLVISLLTVLDGTSYAFGVSRNIVIHDNNSFEIEGLAFEIKEKEFKVMVVTGEITDPSRWKIINQQSITVDKNNYFSITTPPFESNQVEQNKVSLVMINDNTPLSNFYDYPFSEEDRKPVKQFNSDSFVAPVEVEKDSLQTTKEEDEKVSSYPSEVEKSTELPTAKDGNEKIRDRVTYIFDQRQNQVTVRTTRISFDTGMKKVNEYNFTDQILLPSHYEFESTNPFNQQDGIVVDTPQGLKAYTVAVQSTTKGKNGVNIIYEFDYSNLSLRKVKEIQSGKRVNLDEAHLGLYSVQLEKGSAIQYYSLVNNKQVLSGGRLITSEDVTKTSFSLSSAPSSQKFGVYCPKNQYSGCYNVDFGGLKGKTVKVTENSVSYDSKQAASKSFMAGGTKIKWSRSSFQNNTYQWNINGARNGKTISLFKGSAKKLDTFVSPGGKYLVIIVDPSGGIKRTQASKVYVYDLKTLAQVQKYDSLYRASVTGIQWFSDELYIIDYYFSNPAAYPPSFYYIPEGKHFKIEYSQYQYWENYLDSFSYDNLFFLTSPVAVTSGEGVLHYDGQPTFYMNGLYYIPLKEFVNAFHIQYEEKDKNYLFKRNSQTSKLAVSQSKQLVVNGKVFLPLGQWNKDLGLKVAQVDKHTMNVTLQISDEMGKTEVAMKKEIPEFQAILQRLKMASNGSGGFVATGTQYKENSADRARNVVLNHDRSLSINLGTNHSYGDVFNVTIISKDYSKVLMALPINIKGKYQATTAPLPDDVFEDGVLTFAIPIESSAPELLEHSHFGFSLKLPKFNKNKF